jgi:hypothetical protein
MSIAIRYNIYTGKYDIIENPCSDEDYGPCGICMENNIVVYVDSNHLIFEPKSKYSVCARLTTASSDLTEKNINLTRIANLLEPLIKEVLATRNTSQMIQLHKHLLPLLDRIIFTQQIVDNYEIPQISITKSARN